MKKLSVAIVELFGGSFSIRSGDFDKSIATDMEPYMLLEICLASGNSQSEIEDYELVEEFEIPITDSSIFIEGDWKSSDIEIKTNDDTVVMGVYKNKSNKYLIIVPDSIRLHTEIFGGWLEDKNIVISINHGSKTITHSLGFDFGEYDIVEEGEEILQIVVKIFHGSQDVKIPERVTHYHVDNFQSITFDGFISDEMEEIPIQKVIYPSGGFNSVDLYHNANDNEIVVIIK